MQLEQHLRSAKSVRTPSEGNHVYLGQLGSNQTERYYKFRLNHASDLNVGLSGLQADAKLALLDRKGKVLGQSNRKGQLNESINRSLTQGTYYIKVARQKGNTHYRLSLSTTSTTSTLKTALAQPWQSSQFVEQVLALTNVQRQQAGLQPLRLNSALTVAAQAHSEDMAFNDFFGHTSSNGSDIRDRATQAGYDYALVAENVGVGYATPTGIVQAWMNSPEHRANILYPDLQELGVGFYFLPSDTGNVNYRYYWTQDFGKPA